MEDKKVHFIPHLLLKLLRDRPLLQLNLVFDDAPIEDIIYSDKPPSYTPADLYEASRCGSTSDSTPRRRT